jgi:hypothetical protein
LSRPNFLRRLRKNWIFGLKGEVEGPHAPDVVGG